MTQSAAASLTGGASEALLQTLLVAYDFSDASETALRYAIGLAHNFQSLVTVVHVQTPAEFAVEMESGFSQMKESHGQLVCDLRSVAQRLSAEGIRNSVLHRAGRVSDVLVQLAAEYGADLLLLGAYGHRRLDHLRLGSTAEFMLRSMPCAVLTVGPRAILQEHGIRPLRMLLYASALPAKPGKASLFIGRLAHKYGAHVEIIHIIEEQVESNQTRRYAKIREEEEVLARRLQQAGVEVTWRLSSGSQQQLIVERAKEIRADLILFGIEHHPADPDTVGTISSTIQQASCPVLTVPGPA